ncbi:SAF domain-containing protein [Gordonia defluvii]|jgi:Flp pilus assembly protein CpaB|uniref:SAF domain-containing protein n=1 Tax=Gordonia defluvii TaxID=283718 RepID=A0ABN3YA23_9ACTN|nr:SAF domain-containing protein [Gordonia sp. UBA5067]
MPTHRRGQYLAPRLRDRLRHALRPGWTRTLAVRRTAAAVLLVAASVAFIADHRQAPGTATVVAARDLRPGKTLTAADVTVIRIPAEAVPDGALRLSADVRERTVTSIVRRNEVITDSRLLGSRLPGQLTGDPDARLVPIHLADDGTADLLVPGDVVDVLTKGGPSEPPRVIAAGAVVALGSGPTGRRGGNSGSPVLLALNASAAHRVAAAGLTTALTVVIH